MPLMSEIAEHVVIDRLARRLPRSPHQVNAIHEADAELVDLGPTFDWLLAVKADAVVEEIACGLYDDPELMGWMVVMANLSDLAAVGAEPIGVLVTLSGGPQHDDGSQWIDGLGDGIAAACRAAGCFVLGGDTNHGGELMLAGAAVGRVARNEVMTRIGARPGDAVYLTGPAGTGTVFALSRLLGAATGPPTDYRPVARLREALVIRRHASSCMDTSDGVVHTLDTLMRLNGCGFRLSGDWTTIMAPSALALCATRGWPVWAPLAGVHGDFELCHTVARERQAAFLADAASIGWAPVLLGEVTADESIVVPTEVGPVALDTTAIRNLSDMAATDIAGYAARLLELMHATVA